MRSLRALLTALGLLLLAFLLVGLGWAGTRVWRALDWEQLEETADLARKADELAWMGTQTISRETRAPNLVLILFDDLGLGDLGSHGNRVVSTPAMDRLAGEGTVFDTYYAPAPVCTPSRAGLLTGRWPVRTTLTEVVFPTGHPVDWLQRSAHQPVRLPADEITLAEALRAGGYATAAIGKWHLGDHSPSLPRNLGFEEYFGVLYSNDMSPFALWHDEAIIAPDPVDQATLTPRYTRQAVRFIEAHANEPFFLYLAHTFPHIPLHATADQAGTSPAGLYGDVVSDLDRSVGIVVETLEALGLSEQTLVVVTSDNGPWFQGSPSTFRGRKSDTFEGGMRVPFIARWPGRVPAGLRTRTVAAGVDVFPTFLGIAGVPLPRDRLIDGVDLMPVLSGSASEAETRPIFYYSGDELQAVRLGRFKWQAARRLSYGKIPGLPFFGSVERGPWLFDLEDDPGEAYDVSDFHPDAFARLAAIARTHEREVARAPRGWKPRRSTTSAPPHTSPMARPHPAPLSPGSSHRRASGIRR